LGGCTSENNSRNEHVCKAGYQDVSCHEGFNTNLRLPTLQLWRQFQAFCERWGIKHKFSLTYSPPGNGCCEVLHRIVAQRLRPQPEPHNSVDALPKIILAMNTFVKPDIKMSAAMKAFNTNLRLPTQPLFDIFE